MAYAPKPFSRSPSQPERGTSSPRYTPTRRRLRPSAAVRESRLLDGGGAATSASLAASRSVGSGGCWFPDSPRAQQRTENSPGQWKAARERPASTRMPGQSTRALRGLWAGEVGPIISQLRKLSAAEPPTGNLRMLGTHLSDLLELSYCIVLLKRLNLTLYESVFSSLYVMEEFLRRGREVKLFFGGGRGAKIYPTLKRLKSLCLLMN